MNVNSRIARANFTGYASGTIASFTGLREAPIDIRSYINPIQTGSGNPTPQNIRPISGRDNITITANSVDNEIDLDNTVYGGYLDVNAGVLTIDTKCLFFDSAEYYGIFGSYNAPLFYVDITNQGIKFMPTSSNSGTLLSNMAKKISVGGAQSMLNYEIRTEAATQPTRLYFRMDDFTNKEEIDAFLADHPLQVVASLAKPITIQLTPTQIDQIIGSNSISSDSGNVEVYFVTI